MSTDWYTKLVLTVVAVCLALLVVHGFRDGAGAGASSPDEDRYRLTPIPMARMVLRLDAVTGETWKAMLPDLNLWAPIADSPAELLEQASAEVPEVPEAPAPEATPPAAANLEAGASEDAVTP